MPAQSEGQYQPWGTMAGAFCGWHRRGRNAAWEKLTAARSCEVWLTLLAKTHGLGEYQVLPAGTTPADVQP